MAKEVLTTRDGALWVQPDGPNTPVHFLGCHDLGDITEPSGSSELARCFDKRGGWKTVGSTSAPPDKVGTSIEHMTYMTLDWLEKINGKFNLYALQRSGGEPDIFTNYGRAIILNNARITSRVDKAIVHHDTETPSSQSVDIEAYPPVLRTGELVARRQITAETEALNDIWVYGSGLKAVAGAGANLYTGDVLQTLDGSTWAATSTDPFATGKSVMSVAVFPLTATVSRILVAQEAGTGAQGKVAYSDDNGATWVTVNIGGATAGHGAVDSGALFAVDQSNIWLASAKGYIYFSEDGGVSWTAQHAGSLTVKDVLAISFIDSDTGLAVTADDIVLKTTDGGTTWELGGSTGTGDDLQCVAGTVDFWWVGTETGHTFYSGDGGTTWTERTTWSGAGTGTIDDIMFANDLIGYAIHTVSGSSEILVTINGGFSWKAIVTPSNAGLNALFAYDSNTIYAVGEPESGTAVIVKITWG